MEIKVRIALASLVMLSAASAVTAGAERSLAAIEAQCGQAQECDALIEFLVATGGEIRPDTVQRGLTAVFGSMTAQTAAKLPRFLRDLVSVGLTAEERGVIEDGLSSSVCSSSLSAEQKFLMLGSIVEISGARAGLGHKLGTTTGGSASNVQPCSPVRAAYLS